MIAKPSPLVNLVVLRGQPVWVLQFIQKFEGYYPTAISCGDEVLPTVLQTSLRGLSINDCPNLILIPDLPEFRSLTQLEISGCPNLEFIPDIGEVRSLTQVDIFKCQKLTRLPQWLSDCRLNSLSIGGFCEELDVFSILSSMTSIHASLKSLCLYGGTRLNSIPDVIQHFTAIYDLSIREFDGMETLPECCANYSKTDGRRRKKNGVISFDNCKQYSTPIFHIPIIQKLCGYFVGAMQEGKELKCINEQKSLGPMGAVLCTIIML
nr:hypothetical protein CFP56_59191 [Quercus suber]